MTVTPSSRVATCMRCLDTGPAHGQCGGHLFETGAALQRDGGGAQRVRYLMLAVHGQLDVDLSPGCAQPEPRPRQRVECDGTGPHVGVRRAAHSHHPRGRLVGHRGHRGVVDVEDDHSGGRNSLRQFGFRRRNGLPGAEFTEVCGTDVQHDRDRRRRYRC